MRGQRLGTSFWNGVHLGYFLTFEKESAFVTDLHQTSSYWDQF